MNNAEDEIKSTNPKTSGKNGESAHQHYPNGGIITTYKVAKTVK